MSSSSSLIDSNTDFGVKVSKHLVQDTIIWLTTVSPSGTPQPKLRNIAANSRVSLNLNSTATGGDVIVFTGTARVDADGASAAELDAFVEKYT
ncbi:hypothetical protein ACWDNI_36860 [Nocardia niigatensis]